MHPTTREKLRSHIHRHGLKYPLAAFFILSALKISYEYEVRTVSNKATQYMVTEHGWPEKSTRAVEVLDDTASVIHACGSLATAVVLINNVHDPPEAAWVCVWPDHRSVATTSP